ncbi:glycosyltransferase [Halomicrobium mukohataei]|uniref:Glycosyltransferase n=1 Tax=Halomicrobium mukohataei TaxID=57705 RepID=A0A847UBW1_9EURY|nr:glycosyltransferase family 4 protein [Halomicrobium mukohataei]NLV08371.1 glycosyltransferase [Halomicrobium mukohataei]
MDVAVVDPSGFTPPYDHHFCGGLASQSCRVTLFTSGEWNEWDAKSYARDQHFYARTERLPAPVSDSGLQPAIKGIEHVHDMNRLLVRLRRRDPDIIHFQWLPVPAIDAAYVRVLRRIAPTVLTVHDSNPFHGEPTSRLQLAGAQLAPRAFDHLVAHTEATRRNLLEQGVSDSALSVIPHGILRYSERTEQRNVRGPDVRRDSSRCQEDIHVLFFGTLKPYKGLDVLLEAFAELPGDVRDSARLRIAGKPMMDITHLRTMAADLDVEDSVDWEVGFVPHEAVPSLFEWADVVVFPYREIDQSGALMTAIPFGTPIVASAVGGFDEVLTDGRHGRLVPPEDPQALSTALSSIISNPDQRAMMGEAVRELVETTYSWDEIGRSYIELYERLLGS